MTVPLSFSEFWVQIHELPPGLMSVTMAMQFGNFIGSFIKYDTTVPALGVLKFLRIKVRLDVNRPLKRRKKIIVGNGKVFYASFQYEHLSLFCFICGKIGHEESFYPFRVHLDPSKVVFRWTHHFRCRREGDWRLPVNGYVVLMGRRLTFRLRKVRW